MAKSINEIMKDLERHVKNRNMNEVVLCIKAARLELAKLPEHHADHHTWDPVLRFYLSYCPLLPVFRNGANHQGNTFRIYAKWTLQEEAYKLIHGYSSLLRKKVFTDELKVPEQVEHDEKDDVSYHCLVLVGDALATYARMVINQKSGSCWAALDRMCTVGGLVDPQNPPKYSYRKQGKVNFLIESIINHIQQGRLKTPIPVNILALEIPVRSRRLVDSLRAKGFRLVISDEEYQQLQNTQLPVIFMENERVRINSTTIYLPIPGVAQEAIEKDLNVIRERVYARIRLASDPLFQSQAQHRMKDLSR